MLSRSILLVFLKDTAKPCFVGPGKFEGTTSADRLRWEIAQSVADIRGAVPLMC